METYITFLAPHIICGETLLSRARRIIREEKDPIIDLSGSSLNVYVALASANRPLTIREIQKLVGFKSPNSVRHHLEKLISLGYVKRAELGYIAVKPSRSLLNTIVFIKGHVLPRQVFTFLSALLLTIMYIVVKYPVFDPIALLVLVTITALLGYDSMMTYIYLKPLMSIRRSVKK